MDNNLGTVSLPVALGSSYTLVCVRVQSAETTACDATLR